MQKKNVSMEVKWAGWKEMQADRHVQLVVPPNKFKGINNGTFPICEILKNVG